MNFTNKIFLFTALTSALCSPLSFADYIMRIPLERSHGGTLENGSIQWKTASVDTPVTSPEESSEPATPEEPAPEEEKYKTLWQGSFSEYEHNRYYSSNDDALLYDYYADEIERTGNEGGRLEIYLKMEVPAYGGDGFYIVTNGGPACYFYAEQCNPSGCGYRQNENNIVYKTTLMPLGDRGICDRDLHANDPGYNNVKIQLWKPN